ncbi:MAG: chemotaxis protein CheB [Cyanobacteriota bacterium]
MNKERNSKVIVIGTSAGGLSALSFILENLSENYPFPIIIVQHRSKDLKNLLEEILQNKCKIKIKQADEKEKIQSGFVYIAPPDYHLLIENDMTFSLSSDELVHFSRPSIDVLFESAAMVYKDKLIGIILTGANSDGAKGIKIINESGGLTIAQNPTEAEFPFMPNASIQTNNIKYIMTLTEITNYLLILKEKDMEKKDKSIILIVDDKSANIIALEALLTTQDRAFLKATNGKDALKIALNKEIDLIILDVQMPDMDGFEVAQILKLNKKTKDIPIIFATAESKEHKSMIKGFEEGCVDYLFKPLDSEIAKAKVSVLLKIQLQKKELIEKNLSLEKSALLINNSADIIGIIDSTSFKIEEINKAFTNILGYSHEETKETALIFFLSNEDRIIVQKLSKSDKEQLSFETRIYCKNRSIKWLQWNVVSKYGKWFVNARDITEIKHVEKIRNYLATVVKQSSDAIYIHDQEGKIISWNKGAEEIYGYTENEALKMKIWNIIPEYMQTKTQSITDKIFFGEKIQEIETQRITKHGKLIDVLFSASLIIDSHNSYKSIAINERDITKQKIADEQIKHLNINLQNNILQLESINKELEFFSYSISHDLKSPLRHINSYIQILRDEISNLLNEDNTKYLNIVSDSAKLMDHLIDDLLKFSKLGRKEIKKTEIDILKLIENILTEINNITPHNATIKITPLSSAEADYNLLNQVWINLICNAIKYSSKKEKPLIEIGETRSENEITYYIKDNGAGFNMKYVDKLFGVFQRLHKASEFEGTGVGLAIVNRIITKHGGRVWADSILNEGSTFFFTLPI